MTLEEIEAKSYLVGGAVRDRLLGRTVEDRDFVVVGVSPAAMLSAGFQAVGADFPVFLHPTTREEYALARTERKSGHGYTGFVVHAGPEVTLEDDLRRRDFTINAMALDHRGTVIDPYGGLSDLAAGVLRHVSEAFAEDPVRILRAARFLARYVHCRLAAETLDMMRAMVANGEVDHLVPERVWQELKRALLETRPSAFLACLRDCGALVRILPELCDVAPAIDRSGTAAPGDDLIAYAVLCAELSPTAALQLSTRLKVPGEHRDLARLVSARRSTYELYASLDAEQRLLLFEFTDAMRRPERALQFAQACAIAGNAPGNPQFAEDVQRIRRVDVAGCIAAGFTGAALGTELRRRRLAILTSSPDESDCA